MAVTSHLSLSLCIEEERRVSVIVCVYYCDRGERSCVRLITAAAPPALCLQHQGEPHSTAGQRKKEECRDGERKAVAKKDKLEKGQDDKGERREEERRGGLKKEK